jgi:hypothetical protein
MYRPQFVSSNTRTSNESLWYFPDIQQGIGLDIEFFKEVLAFHYPPWGRTPFEGVSIGQIFNVEEIQGLVRASLTSIPFDLKLIKRELDAGIASERPKFEASKGVLMLMGSGPDSAWLASSIAKLDCKMRCVTLQGLGIDEVDMTQKICDSLGVELTVVQVTEEMCIKNRKPMIRAIGVPFDMGSLFFSYFGSAEAEPGEVIVWGDCGGDNIFAPSISSHYNMLEGGFYNPYAISIYDWQKLFGDEVRRPPNPYIFQNSFTNELLFSLLSTYPNYYWLKPFIFAKAFKADASMPFATIPLYKISLSMEEIHTRYPYKKWLMECIKMNNEEVYNSVIKRKVALKTKPPMEYIIGEEQGNEFYMRMLNEIGSHKIDNNGLDPWTRYMLALFATWFDVFKRG